MQRRVALRTERAAYAEGISGGFKKDGSPFRTLWSPFIFQQVVCFELSSLTSLHWTVAPFEPRLLGTLTPTLSTDRATSLCRVLIVAVLQAASVGAFTKGQRHWQLISLPDFLLDSPVVSPGRPAEERADRFLDDLG